MTVFKAPCLTSAVSLEITGTPISSDDAPVEYIARTIGTKQQVPGRRAEFVNTDGLGSCGRCMTSAWTMLGILLGTVRDNPANPGTGRDQPETNGQVNGIIRGRPGSSGMIVFVASKLIMRVRSRRPL